LGVVGVAVAVVAADRCAISSWKEDADLAVWRSIKPDLSEQTLTQHQ
jgi:ferritin-like protein